MGKKNATLLERTATETCQGAERDPKVVWIGGDHPRHLYFANQLNESYGLAAMVVQPREAMIPEEPANLPAVDSNNWARHFVGRLNAEHRYFSADLLNLPAIPDISCMNVAKETLNSSETAEFVQDHNPDIVFIFGCGMIRDDLMDVLPRDTINLHLGLSPRYRGAASQFWPFYFLEPQWCGSTFHRIVDEPDAGDILHQSAPVLRSSDGIHDVACKTVIASTVDAIALIHLWPAWKYVRQRATGKNFLVSDFKPEMLRLIYGVYKNHIVAEYLSGSFTKGKQPRLVSAF